MEKQENNKINFLDLSISKTQNEIQLSIYRKPITTHLIIHDASCNSLRHKKSDINFLLNRITPENKKDEETTINVIINNNNYPSNAIQYKQKLKKKKTKTTKLRKEKKKMKKNWTTFTSFGPETRAITKLLVFKNTDIAISYRTN
jgi:hypothetical protein